MGVEGLKFVITGSGTGIGAATARVAASKGAAVMVSDLNDDNGNAVVDEIPPRAAPLPTTTATSPIRPRSRR